MPIVDNSQGKIKVTRNAVAELMKPTKETAMPRTRFGKSSENSTHMIGPSDIAKLATNPSIPMRIRVGFISIAAETIADYAASKGLREDTLVVGPDRESQQWVARVASRLGGTALVGEKTRYSDRRVEIAFPSGDISDRNILLVDDIVSSGGTVMKAAEKLKALGAGHVTLAVTHALFPREIGEALRKAGIDTVWATDSARHEASCIALAPLLAASLSNELGQEKES